MGLIHITYMKHLELKCLHIVIDFSANINPLGPPASLGENWSSFYSSITQYPDPHAAQLTKRLAEKEGLPESSILIGNGGAEMITLVGR